jgi:SpoVK/Ycf46/Vps4 family AAA+-type ATPase
MTRDNSLTIRGVNETRRGYRNLKGITAVNTAISYYVCPEPLQKWIDNSAGFFMNPVHESLTPRGLLLDGPPGTGKTLAPKHIAATLGIPLYHLDIGALKGKYVGESEGNFLAALDQADEVEPCVILIDEVEKIFQTQGDSGVTNSLLSQFLWWLQEHKSRVLTVMTTNDISIIPAELYREGRVDETMQFLGIKNVKEGLEFATGAFMSLAQEIGYTDSFLGDTTAKELAKRIKALYSEDTAVPQARLTKVTYAYIKELIGAQK